MKKSKSNLIKIIGAGIASIAAIAPGMMQNSNAENQITNVRQQGQQATQPGTNNATTFYVQPMIVDNRNLLLHRRRRGQWSPGYLSRFKAKQKCKLHCRPKNK